MTTLPRLHLVTDDTVLADAAFPDIAEAVLECCGPDVALHLRGHGTTGSRLHALAVHLRAAASRAGAALIVNDRVDVAIAVHADGVQLGSRSIAPADARALIGRGCVIGCSVHSAAEAAQSEHEGADFVLLGTIFESRTHAGSPGAGTALVSASAARTALPVVAIGGITTERVREVAAAGAYGVAVLGGVWRAADPCAAAAAYAGSVRAAWQSAARQSAAADAGT